MEALSEQERFYHRILPHDASYTPEQLAIQALIDRFTEREDTGGK